MKSKLLIPKLGLLLLSFAGAVFSALAFANNVSAVARWWRIFLASGGDTAQLKANVGGFMSCFDWTVVDYSTVTTLIPFIGFCCMTVAAIRLLSGRRLSSDSFPFFRGSDQLHIALGLFGTLWGIIVIGYFQLDKVTMSDLMQCLHTALFSTLMAVVWVYMVDRPLVRPLFRWILKKSDQCATDDSDLSEAVDRLIERLGAASDAFERRQAEYEKAFEARQKEYTEFFTRRIAELEKHAAESDAKLKAVVAAVK